jgi:enamine deaminase RidA (YjgF/YER057c/UK114 family)
MGPVISQTWTLYERFDTFLRELGLGLSQVANATLFIHDEGDFADAMRVHERWFGSEGPALQVISVDEVGHKGSVIEIEITATRGSLRRMPGSSGAPPPVVQADGLIFVSDHLPITDDRRILWIDEASDYVRREAELARITGDLAPEQQFLATQVWVALKNLRESLDEFGIEAGALGQVTVRLLDPSRSGLLWLDEMFRSALGDVDRAVVLLSVPWIPQSRYARASVAGVGFSDE